MYFIFREAVVIPNAWGMKSVKLDGVEIDYAKDWKGTFENLTNDKAHTLKFEWNPLATELVNAGYTYRTNFDCYTVGSNTPTTSVPISATATEYSHTIPAGAASSVYPFDLQLNLQKGGSSVGIFSNQHIVKLVVNEAPVVTEISSAPVKLSAALTPDTPAPRCYGCRQRLYRGQHQLVYGQCMQYPSKHHRCRNEILWKNRSEARKEL